MFDQRPAKAAIAFLSSEDTAFDTNSARTNAAISRFERGIPHQHVSCAFGSIANPGYVSGTLWEVQFLVFYVSGRLWEGQFVVFYVSGRFWEVQFVVFYVSGRLWEA